jgi:hypothetical protein
LKISRPMICCVHAVVVDRAALDRRAGLVGGHRAVSSPSARIGAAGAVSARGA